MSQWTAKQEQRRREIRQECDRRGLRIRPYGNAWWIEGLGVNIVAVDLASITVQDLTPHLVTSR